MSGLWHGRKLDGLMPENNPPTIAVTLPTDDAEINAMAAINQILIEACGMEKI